MNGPKDGTITLPKGVSVTVGGRTFQGECPDRLLVPEHKLRRPVEVKKASRATSKAD